MGDVKGKLQKRGRMKTESAGGEEVECRNTKLGQIFFIINDRR